MKTDAFNIQFECFISYTNILLVVFSGAHSQNMLVNFSEDHFIMQEPGAIQLLKSCSPNEICQLRNLFYCKAPGPNILILWINQENILSDPDRQFYKVITWLLFLWLLSWLTFLLLLGWRVVLKPSKEEAPIKTTHSCTTKTSHNDLKKTPLIWSC